MAYTLMLTDGVQENIDETIDILKVRIGIDLHKKDLIPLLFRNPAAAAEVVIQNIKQIT